MKKQARACLRTVAVLGLMMVGSALTPVFALITGGIISIESSSTDTGGGALLASGSIDLQGTLGQTMIPTGSTDTLTGGVTELRTGFLNPPRFSLQSALAYTLPSTDGELVLNLPAGAVIRPTFDAVIRRDPASFPLSVDPAKIARANAKIVANDGLAQVRPSDVWEVQFFDEAGFFGGALAAEGQLRLTYKDLNGDGIVDGTTPPLRVKTMDLWMLDESLELWVKVPNSSVDSVAQVVTAPLSHMSVYAMIGGADTAVASVYAFPVPFRPNGPNAGIGAGQTGTAAGGITFTNLPSGGTIDIYTIEGRLIKRLDIPANLAPARIIWDAQVASGVYVWRIAFGGNAKTGRLMVVR